MVHQTNANISLRPWSAVLLAATVAATVYVIISGAPDNPDTMTVAGAATTSAVVIPPTTRAAVTTGSVAVLGKTTVKPAAAPSAPAASTTTPTSRAASTTISPATTSTRANDPLTFRKPLNGTVSVTLKWDCYNCVDWPTLRNKHHPATDYLSNDTTIVATADGVVVKMNTGCGGQGCGNSYGNWVFLKHTLPDGSNLFSFYAHMSETSLGVTQGACVKTGQKIGVIGNTGLASPAHLHFSIQSNTNLLDYTSDSSTTVGSIDPDTLYGKTKVRSC